MLSWSYIGNELYLVCHISGGQLAGNRIYAWISTRLHKYFSIINQSSSWILRTGDRIRLNLALVCGVSELNE